MRAVLHVLLRVVETGISEAKTEKGRRQRQGTYLVAYMETVGSRQNIRVPFIETSCGFYSIYSICANVRQYTK